MVDGCMCCVRAVLCCARCAILLRFVCGWIIQDESGDVGPAEFARALERFGMVLNSADLKRYFSKFDTDRSGAISYDEFIEQVYGEE